MKALLSVCAPSCELFYYLLRAIWGQHWKDKQSTFSCGSETLYKSYNNNINKKTSICSRCRSIKLPLTAGATLISKESEKQIQTSLIKASWKQEESKPLGLFLQSRIIFPSQKFSPLSLQNEFLAKSYSLLSCKLIVSQ